MQLRLTSPAFAEGSAIPKRFTADGDDVSPPLTWNEGPPGTNGFALLCEDPDAPRGTFTHWVAWNIPPDRYALSEGEASTGAIAQGENGFGDEGWHGPSPPPGKPHRYVFRLFALDEPIRLHKGATKHDLERAIEGHVLAEADLIAVYGR